MSKITQKILYQKRVAAGLCVRCDKPVEMIGRKKCDKCSLKYRKFRQSIVQSGKCSICLINPQLVGYKMCQVCLDKQRAAYNPVTEKEYRKTIVLKRRAAGQCIKCINLVKPGRVLCQHHIDVGVSKAAIRRMSRIDAGLCVECGLNDKRDGSLSCQACADRFRKYYNDNTTKLVWVAKRNYRIRFNKLKLAAYEAYGNKCKCCGELNQDYFTLDHINNDGKLHRKILGSEDGSGPSETLYRWLKDNNYPDNIQILCANCHMAKTRGLVCKH